MPEAAAGKAELIMQIRSFVAWAGPERKLTATGRIGLADARLVDPAIGFPRGRRGRRCVTSTRCYSQHSPFARSSSPGYSVSLASRAAMIRPASSLVRR